MIGQAEIFTSSFSYQVMMLIAGGDLLDKAHRPGEYLA